MSLNNVSYNPLPIYDNISKQHARKSYAYGHSYPIFTPVGTFPQFQFAVPSGTSVSSALTTYRVRDGAIVVNAATPVAVTKEFNGEERTIIRGDGLTNGSLVAGECYYFKVNTSAGDYYSDYFMPYDISSMIKLQWWSDRDILYKGGFIDYAGGYKNTAYIKSEIGKPSYPFSEEIEERDGYKFAEFQISVKKHKFSFLANEPFIDAIRLIRLHDKVTIESKDYSYQINDFLMNDPAWLERGDLANLVIEFEVDSVVSTPGKGYAVVSGGDYADEDFTTDDYN